MIHLILKFANHADHAQIGLFVPFPNFVRLVIIGLSTYAALVLYGDPLPAQSFARNGECRIVTGLRQHPLVDRFDTRHFIDFPVVANTKAGVVWYGKTVSSWPPDQSWGRSFGGILVGKDGTFSPVKHPTKDKRPEMPTLVGERDGTARVVFGVVDSQPVSGLVGLVQSIRYAEFDGRKWQKQATVIAAQDIWWFPGRFSTASNSFGTFVAVVSGSPSDAARASRIIVARRTNGRWTQSVAVTRPSAYSILSVRLVTLASGRIILVYTGASQIDDGPRTAMIMASESVDSGVTWSQTRILRRLPIASSIELVDLLANPSGQVHLFWMERDGETSSSISHLSSADEGTTWREEQVTSLSGALSYSIVKGIDKHFLITARTADSRLVQVLAGYDSSLVTISPSPSTLPMVRESTPTKVQTIFGVQERVSSVGRQLGGITTTLSTIESYIECEMTK